MGYNRGQQEEVFLDGLCTVLTPARMIQMTVTAAPLITTEQNRDPRAPRRVSTRSASWVDRAYLTRSFVLWLMGVNELAVLKEPHYIHH